MYVRVGVATVVCPESAMGFHCVKAYCGQVYLEILASADIHFFKKSFVLIFTCALVNYVHEIKLMEVTLVVFVAIRKVTTMD